MVQRRPWTHYRGSRRSCSSSGCAASSATSWLRIPAKQSGAPITQVASSHIVGQLCWQDSHGSRSPSCSYQACESSALSTIQHCAGSGRSHMPLSFPTY